MAFCNSCDTLKIEKVQYRTLKYVFNRSYVNVKRRAIVRIEGNCFIGGV